MKKTTCLTILPLFILTLLWCLYPSDALAVGENNKGLELLSSKYPPHEYEIVVTKREDKVTNENMIRSTFSGQGIGTINFTGQFAGTVRMNGGITLGGILGPGMLNGTFGSDKTKSISLSQTYAVNIPADRTYIVVARPIYEYCQFYIRHKPSKKIVNRGDSERPIGLQCTHYTQEEWDAEESKQMNKHDECKPMSLSDLEEESRAYNDSHQLSTTLKMKERVCGFWGFLAAASE